jgi:hypothetical protein
LCFFLLLFFLLRTFFPTAARATSSDKREAVKVALWYENYILRVNVTVAGVTMRVPIPLAILVDGWGAVTGVRMLYTRTIMGGFAISMQLQSGSTEAAQQGLVIFGTFFCFVFFCFCFLSDTLSLCNVLIRR